MARRITYRVRVLVLVAVIVTSFTSASAQVRDKVHAALIMNFARNIEWPKEQTSGEFVIGVVNYPPVASQLKSVAAQLKNIHNQPITIKEFGSASKVDFCHILFIPESDNASLSALLNKIQNVPTLLITERQGSAKKGSGINFILVDGKLKYELNTGSLEKRGLKASDDLQRFGILVQEPMSKKVTSNGFNSQ